MNWYRVKQTNRRASARKARRERLDTERAAMQARLGGPVSVGELRSAARELRKCVGGYGPFEVEVWTFRGREWRLIFCADPDYPMAVPHVAYRQDPEMREFVPLTPGARKAVTSGEFPPLSPG